jgi:hypothetical protein
VAYQQYEPMDPREAFQEMPSVFSESTQSAAASQAALLLAVRGGVLGVPDDVREDWIRETEGTPLELPELRPIRRERRMAVAEATAYLGASPDELAAEETPDLRTELSRTVRDLYDDPDTHKAAALFEGAMRSEHPLVRVAAAAGARETTRMRNRIRTILYEGVTSDDPLVRRLAEVALGWIDRDDPLVQGMVIDRPPSAGRDRESHTAAITHGTFAADSLWYRPGGSYYEALASRRPDVHDESFTWTGAYSHGARSADATLLAQWIDDQGLDRPDFFAHSHGGTVAHLSTWRGAEFDRLVLMGWPVHGEWFPDFTRVQRIIDVRVKFDLVIALDRGGQRFRTGSFDVEEHRNGWFNHSSTREPEYWDDHDLWQHVI